MFIYDPRIRIDISAQRISAQPRIDISHARDQVPNRRLHLGVPRFRERVCWNSPHRPQHASAECSRSDTASHTRTSATTAVTQESEA